MKRLKMWAMTCATILAAGCGDGATEGISEGAKVVSDTIAPKDTYVGVEPAPFLADEKLSSQSDGHYFVRGDFGRLPLVYTEQARKSGDDIRAVLNGLAPKFHLRGEDLIFRTQNVDQQGHRHVRFQQLHQGLLVIGGELVIHVDPQGRVYAANGSARGDFAVSPLATITPEAAKGVAARSSLAVPATIDGPPEQVFLRPEGDKEMHLAWKFGVKGQRDGMPTQDFVYVDATDGALLAIYPQIHSALNRRLHIARNTTTLPGTLVRTEGKPPHTDPVVNTNYNHLGTVYNCYRDLFGRDSFDNSGSAITSTVHYGVSLVNAFWNGTQLVYGDGDGVTASNLANSLDLTAHELTHAVTTYTSNLSYSGQPGGLNESMSDIFGAVCQWYGDSRVVSNRTWMIGDDVWTPSIPNDALRYMANPKQDGASLDCFNDYSSGTSVHFSSGISNLAFYLLAQGGTHPRGRTTTDVPGIGIEKAARIFYKANADFLVSNSGFEAAKVATEQAAVELGYDIATKDAVSNAWRAVCVGVISPPTAVPITLAMAFTDPPRQDNEVPPDDSFLPDLPILVDGQQYTAAQIRDQDIFLAHYVLDANSAQLNVIQGFRTSADLQAYLTATNQFPSEQPTALQRAACNTPAQFFEHDNFRGEQLSLSPGWAYRQLGGFWNDRMSSVKSSWCGRWTLLSEHINFDGHKFWVVGGNEIPRLGTGGWYTGFWPFRSWRTWNDRVSSVGVFW
ncbi:M4 family metallopeptidase [Myxococcus stipitatus]|uniref:M4 family metallopeptidase n=1 Tax=Myxococcus stipitatus TaxID=83455 RepID=UPI0030D2087B